MTAIRYGEITPDPPQPPRPVRVERIADTPRARLGAAPIRPPAAVPTKPARTVWLDVNEVAARLYVSKMTIYRLVNSEELPSIRVGRNVRISEAALEAWVKAGGSPIEEP